MAFNPTCDCGEEMWLERTADAAFDYFPGSPEIMQLFAMDARGVKLVWVCHGCGYYKGAGWRPPAPRRAPKRGPGRGGSRGRQR